MTRDDYLQLVQSSEVFQGLDPDFQKRIMNAQGEEMERYMHIFHTEKNGILAAKKDLIARNEQVLQEFEMGAKKMRRGFMKDAEAKDRQTEAQQAAKLLDTM